MSLPVLLLVSLFKQPVMLSGDGQVHTDEATCGATRLVQAARVSDGYFSAPMRSHGRDLDCQYTLSAASGLVVHLTFTHFQLRPPLTRSGQCLTEYLVITIVDRQGRRHVGKRLCGNQLPAPLHTMQRVVLIRFHANHATNVRRSAFRLHYQFLAEEDILEPASVYFDDDLRYLRHCGGRNRKRTYDGEIHNPGYPTFYPKNVTCNWLIRVNPGKKIYIRIKYLELSPTMAECERASLYLIDGYRHEPSDSPSRLDDGSQVKFCGSQLYYTEEGMKSFMSTGNRLIVRFVTRDHPSAALLAKYEEEGRPIGFSLVWTEVDDLLVDGQSCPGFTCHGGDLCIDDGQNICASRSQLCIDKSLACNGVHNCAENDYSDEQDCYSQQIIVPTIAAITLIIALIISMIICKYCSSRKREEQKQEIEVNVQQQQQYHLQQHQQQNDELFHLNVDNQETSATNNGKNSIVWQTNSGTNEDSNSSINFQPSLWAAEHNHLHNCQLRSALL